MAQRENTERWNLEQRQADREALRRRTITVLERIAWEYVGLAADHGLDIRKSKWVKEARKLNEELRQVN